MEREIYPWDLVPAIYSYDDDPLQQFWPMRPRTYSVACCAWWILSGDDADLLNLACCYDDTVAAGLVWC